MTMAEKRARHRRFFEPPQKGEGGYLAVTSVIDDSGKLPYALPEPKNLEEKWLSTDYRVKRAEAAAQNTYWGQDAIQCEFVNFGPGVQAALLGAPYKIEPDSIWFDTDPPIKSWDNLPGFTTDKNHELYKAIEDHTKALCAASKGRYIPSVTDIGGQYDVLFSLRGEELLMDLIEYPEEVIKLENHLDDEFLKYARTLFEIVKDKGYTSWMPLVSDAPYYPLQCDLSVMISPAMFEKFVLPSLDRVSKEIGNSIYHLDGPEEIAHLDMLLSLKHFHAVQWVPLPNPLPTGGALQYYNDELSFGVYRRCLKAGKKVVLLGVSPSQVADIYNNVGTDGVYILTHCPSRKEADQLIEHANNNWLKI